MLTLKKFMAISVILAIVVLFVACSSKIGAIDSLDKGQNEVISDIPGIVGMIEEDIDVPENVLEAGETKVKQLFEINKEDYPEYNYINWKIENLEYMYSYFINEDKDAFEYSDIYKSSEGAKIIIYQMNYELLTQTPENIMLAGGMYITDDNWVMPGYPNSDYLVFQCKDGKLIFLFSMLENDCYPGDDIFTHDLLMALENYVPQPRLGKYEIQNASPSTGSYIILEEANKFQFCRNRALSYMPIGEYEVDGDELLLYVNDNEKYLFKIGEDKLIFESSNIDYKEIEKGHVYLFIEEE